MDDSDLPYVIPLSLKGVASSFPTRKPTPDEYEQLPHLVLTSDSPDYNPHDPTFAEHEDMLAKCISDSGDRIGAAPTVNRICVVVYNRHLPSSLLGIDSVRLSLQAISVTLDEVTLPNAIGTAIMMVRTSAPGKQFDAVHLSRTC